MEHRSQPLLSRRAFIRRILKHAAISFILISAALSIGVFGYHYLADFGWVDSFLNASMILGGMGPVGTLTTDGAKIFAAFYALFSGIVFIALGGVLLAPMFHRIMHALHLNTKS